MDKKQQVLQWLDEHKEDLQKLLSGLIQIPSVSGEEYDVQMAIKAQAEAFGFAVQSKAFDEAQKRPCLMITYEGTGNGKRLMFDAHSDIVPVQPGEKWEHDPFSGDFDGTWIHGRGATDDKWGIATALTAMRALKECGVELPGDVQLLSSVGEEIDINSRRKFGAGAMIKAIEKKPDFCIVCEESSKAVGTETPRNLKFTVEIQGKAVHTCVRRQCVFPQPSGVWSGSGGGVDGLQKAMIVIDALYRLERDLSVNYNRGGLIGTGGVPGGPRGSVGAFTINPTEIRGGGANALMEKVTVTYSAHYPSTYTQEEMLQLLQDTIQGAAMSDLWLREHPPVLTVYAANDGFCTHMDNPVVDVLRQAHAQVYGKPGVASPWVAGCDADVIIDYAPCVVYGPTGRGAHAANERSNLQDLLDTAKVYALTAMDFCQ